MTKLKSFDKSNDLKKDVSNKKVWFLFCALFLVITIFIYKSFAKYFVSSADVLFSNGTVGEYYYEELLNGTDPVLTNNLIPVTIGEDGSVYKANLNSEWYRYEDKRWANAVVLRDPQELLGSENVYGPTIDNDGASFDGIDDYIDLGFEKYSFKNGYTLAINFKLNSIDKSCLIGNWESAGGGIYYEKGLLRGNIWIKELGNYIELSTQFNDINNYHTAVLTYDGSEARLYLDGELVDSYSYVGTLVASNMPFTIASNVDSDGSVRVLSNIIVKEFAIYNNYLTTKEVSENMSENINLINKEGLLKHINFGNYYLNNEIISEDNIESYFVWVPKYSYQLWDLGNYNSHTLLDNSKPHVIPIRFGTSNTSDGVIGECSTPGVAGSSGNCSVGDYMTHPAFLTFNSNGLWVAKFKVGYDGATGPIGNIDTTEIEKIIIKPNSYIWKVNNISLIFKNSYDYLRDDESHLMKNTEWGAVAYLSHSLYGTCDENNCKEIRLNNNTGVVTGYSSLEIPSEVWSPESIETNRFESVAAGIAGQYTVNYFNPVSVLSSTTQNYSGIYDMSGGTWELVSGYSGNALNIGGGSNITDIYTDFYTNSYWNKYYDLYNSSSNTSFDNRILGDATGEMGPFNEMRSSWYQDKTVFINSSNPWMKRGGQSSDGLWAGIFAFNPRYAEASVFRIVLVPNK